MDLTNQNGINDVMDVSLDDVNTTSTTGTSSDITLDDIYFKDAFTKTGNKLNLEVNSAKVDCITSKNNKFSLDEEGNLTVKSITTEKDNSNHLDMAEVLKKVYPVGSLYMSISSTNPSTLFGGTWERINGYYLYAGNGGNTAGSNTSGGPSTNSTGSTAITVAQMPKHKHLIYQDANGNGGRHAVATGYSYGGGSLIARLTNVNEASNLSPNSGDNAKGLVNADYTGSGQGHTHTLNSHTHTVTPLRFEVYMWKRTA